MRIGPFRAAKGVVRPRGMNKIETSYAAYLETLTKAGEILWYQFEPIKLKLAKGSYYKPDFLVVTKDGFLEIHEVKGFWREAARVRIKVAAAIYPFNFLAIQRDRGHWIVEAFE